MNARVVAVAVVLLLPVPGMAGELAGVSMPDEVQVEGRTLVLNGQGMREATWLKVDVYVAGLYLLEKTTDARAIIGSDEPKRIVMEFVRKVKRKSISEAWDEGFEKNAGEEGSSLEERIDRLNSCMIDFKKGDRMSFTFLPGAGAGTGVEVVVNGDAKGIIEGDEFARVLWSIWLGPEPPNPGLKSGMLGL